MARRRRSLSSATTCRLPSNAAPTGCATEKGKTICVGDRVSRTLKRANIGPGTVVGISVGMGNTGKKKQPMVNVCFDSDEPRSLAYGFMLEEVRKR